jgi:hypothetical protein
MATKKTKSAPAVRKAAPRVASKRTGAAPLAAVATVAGNSNRLLREAAWSRMFGRVESKNPFTR